MERLPLDAVRSQSLKYIIDWYLSLREGDRWPSVSAFNISQLPSECWNHIARIDVTPDPFRVFYRAAGQYLCEARGFDFSRKYLDELDIPQREELENWYRIALTLPEPFLTGGVQNVENTRYYYESVCLPLGNTDQSPRSFILAEAADGIEYWREAVRKRRYDFVTENMAQMA